MSTDNFVHLHVHSEYSLLDGACKISDLVEKAVQLKMSALALTDHGKHVWRHRLLRSGKIQGDKTHFGLRGVCGTTQSLSIKNRKTEKKSSVTSPSLPKIMKGIAIF